MKRTELQRTPFRRADPKPAAGPRKRKCAVCREQFAPRSMTHKACKPECAAELVELNKAKAERKAERERRERNKKRGEWVSKAQSVFNDFIRYRDRDKPCICCGSFDASEGIGGGWDAGHWISRGHASHLRFDERNVHKQRKGCNRPGGTTRAKYRVGLVERIGEDAVRELESLEYAPAEKRWSIEECKAIIDTYRAKLRALKASA